MFLAWKKFHRFDASIWELSAAVCALLPIVSENARNSASTEISSATFSCCAPLLVMVAAPIFVLSILDPPCCTACTP